MTGTTRFGCAALTLVLAGCGIEGLEPGFPEDPRSEELRQEDAALGAVDMHKLLTDADMAGFDWVTAEQVQSFLVSKGSFLASYTDPAWGKTAAQLIVERSRAYQISPVYMLARIETESGLIRSGTSSNLASATGCGCPDSGTCDRSYAGFGNQVECSAAKFRGYLRDLEAGRTTVSGWKAGVWRQTLDGCWVLPANNATAALYTYTPWVGAYATQCGTSQWGGSSLVALLYGSFRSSMDWGAPTGPSAIIVDSNNALNDAAVARSSVSASWVATAATPGYHGTGYYYASLATVADPAEFWFYLPEAGTRIIDGWWTAGTNRSTAAPFVAVDAAGTRLGKVTANQQINGSKWNEVGTFAFTQGWNRIRVTRAATTGSVVIADAIRVR